MRTFLLKAKHFFKRNIYPITVSLCTVLILTIVAVSAYSSIKNSNQTIVTNNQNEATNNEENKSDNTSDETNKPNDESKSEDSEPTAADPIIFDLPFDGATISKEYAETCLLYDETTKYWCTHQALDFACNDGQEVKAVYDGVITKIESSMMYGTVVYLKISDELVVVYKGLSSDVSVSEGDSVKSGQVIGKVSGLLAEKADGVHLHLEVYYNDNLVNPEEYFSFSK